MATFDVAVVGGGPGGYVAAIRAAQLGLKVGLFEKERVGGLCLNWGCIPSKALLKNADVVNYVRDAKKWGVTAENPTFDLGSAVDRSRKVVDQLVGGVEGLLRDNGVETISGEAALDGANAITSGGSRYEVRNIVLATGASTRLLPGVEIDGEHIVTSREALVLKKIPERAVVIGAGPIGVEFGHLWASYGAQVTIVELLDGLVPLEDPDVSRQLKRSFEARGIRCLVGTRVDSVRTEASGVRVAISQGSNAEMLDADVVLIAIGFTPHTSGVGLESAGVKTSQRGHIEIGDHMETNVPGVYAIGDVTGKLPLAHVASQQGVIAAETIAGRVTPTLDYIQMPRATFCQPQVGSIGYTEQQAKDAGFTVKSGRFPLAALGKAIAIGETEGFVKVIADQATGQVLGIHMIGHDINDVLGEATMVSLLEATTVEVGFAVHAHPSLPEALKEAALAADGEAIHVARRRAQRTPNPREGAPAT